MHRNHSVSLTDRQQKLVDQLVGSGRYHGAKDVITASLRLLEDHEKQAKDFITHMEREIALGLESGEAKPMESADELLTMFRRQK